MFPCAYILLDQLHKKYFFYYHKFNSMLFSNFTDLK